jgi:hypothetical protein
MKLDLDFGWFAHLAFGETLMKTKHRFVCSGNREYNKLKLGEPVLVMRILS